MKKKDTALPLSKNILTKLRSLFAFLLLSFISLYLCYKLVIFIELSYLKYSDSKFVYDCDINKDANFSDEDMSEISNLKYAGCLINEDNRFLLIEGAFSFEDFGRLGKISFPAGTVAPGESPICTAGREVQEETGIKVKVVKLLYKDKNNFGLFQCIPLEKITDKQLEYKKYFEVKKLHFVKRQEILDERSEISKKFRFAEDLKYLRKISE